MRTSSWAAISRPASVSKSGNLLVQAVGILARRQLEPVAGNGNAGHGEPPQLVGIPHQSVVERARFGPRVVAVDNLANRSDDGFGPAGLFQQLTGQPHALPLMQEADVGLHHVGPETLFDDVVHIDLPPADVVQQQPERHDVRVGFRIGPQKLLGEGKRQRDVDVVLARPHVRLGGAPDVVIAAGTFEFCQHVAFRKKTAGRKRPAGLRGQGISIRKEL